MADDQETMPIGTRAPSLLHDVNFRRKLASHPPPTIDRPGSNDTAAIEVGQTWRSRFVLSPIDELRIVSPTSDRRVWTVEHEPDTRVRITAEHIRTSFRLVEPTPGSAILGGRQLDDDDVSRPESEIAAQRPVIR